MLKGNNFIFGYLQICKEYDMKTNSIIQLLPEINFNEIDKFNIHLSCKVSDVQPYKVFLVFSNNDKFLIADKFDIPDEEVGENVSIIEYNKVYEFIEKNFPVKGTYICDLYAIPLCEYLSQEDNFEKNGNQELYDFLQIKDESLLYRTHFNIK